MNVQVFNDRPRMKPLSPTCCKVDCGEPAHFQPVMLIWAKGDCKRNPKHCLRMEIGLSLCGAHSKTVKASELLTDEGWEMIRKTVIGLGKAEPDRDSCRVELKPIAGNN